MEKYYLAALSHYLGTAAPQKAAKLAALFGSAEEAHKMGKNAVRYLNVPEGLSKHYQNQYHEDFPHSIARYCKDNKVTVLTRTDPAYPFLLQNIFAPPAVLYVQGQPLDNELKLAMVGSRKATAYGLKAAELFATALTQLGVTIVSGGAYGIDGQAHKAALQAKGKTIAVFGGGLANLYPAKHSRLFGEIREQGTLLTEYAPWVEPLAQHFPFRNRIIVGLCQGVLLVEAALKSGTTLTANLALEENREVFCIPGNIFSPTSQGTNQLIKEGACLVAQPSDILAAFLLPGLSTGKKLPENSLFASTQATLSPAQKAVYNIIRSKENITLEELVLKVGLTIQSVSGILIELQLIGKIKQETGNRFLAI